MTGDVWDSLRMAVHIWGCSGIPRQFIDGFYCDRQIKLGFDFIQHIRIVNYDYIRSEDAGLLGKTARKNVVQFIAPLDNLVWDRGKNPLQIKNWKNKILAKSTFL